MTSQKTDTYKKLIFWQRAKEVSLQIVDIIRKLPNDRVAWVISDQVLRCSFSVGANIAEGFGRYKGKEYQRFIQIALGSARETEYWLDTIKDVSPNLSPEVDIILLKNQETIKMLVATIRNLKS